MSNLIDRKYIINYLTKRFKQEHILIYNDRVDLVFIRTNPEKGSTPEQKAEEIEKDILVFLRELKKAPVVLNYTTDGREVIVFFRVRGWTEEILPKQTSSYYKV